MCVVYVHVCVYLYLYVCIFISAGTHVCLGMCVWKPETDVTNHFDIIHCPHYSLSHGLPIKPRAH